MNLWEGKERNNEVKIGGLEMRKGVNEQKITSLAMYKGVNDLYSYTYR